MLRAVKVAVQGRVQGVGFRPFVFQLAEKYHLAGTVQNNMDGVKIHIEGESVQIEVFLSDLENKAPRLSKINKIIREETAVSGRSGFSIIPSERSGTSMLIIPIDSAVCDDCLNEMNDPNDFRYQYPFINCTQCGPRYTIIRELPYDRPYTSMSEFPMCDDCRREYEDPMNRRHHAQPIACPKCGPQVKLLDINGNELESATQIESTIKLLSEGKIIAIKGIGGYHLCCDARNEKAVAELRKRKNRPIRPLAVMAASLQAAKKFADITKEEKVLMESPEAPIVILKKGEAYRLAESVAPGMTTIGVMLPYTPLHHLLFQTGEISCLIMTSANPSGQPIMYRDDKALDYMKGIADYFLTHNREILHPVDDSVVQINNGKTDFFRRSRGYVPDPFATDRDVTGIIALGGQQKNTFTIGRNEQIFIGPHIGDLENLETINHYKQELEHLLKWIDTPKKAAVIDAHPGYYVRKLANEFARVIEVQHHHAHMAACMEEHKIEGEVFGIILDGTGYGPDGNVWGFEILHGERADFKRLAHLKYTPLPGNEKSIREPWRNAVAMLMDLHGDRGAELAKKIFPEKTNEIDILRAMIDKKVNTIQAGTCGRLFDAVSAICGITKVSTYDGEAAILLSELANENNILTSYGYNFNFEDGHLVFDFSKMIEQIAEDVLSGIDKCKISGRFHETVAEAIIRAMEIIVRDSERKVVLSGGSFHNRYLRKRISEELTKKGFEVFVPEKIPCNDGGLSFGQLAAAEAKRRKESCVLAYQQK